MTSDSPFNPIPIVLDGSVVRLEPLTLDHAQALHAVEQDEDIWRYLPSIPMPKCVDDTRAWISTALTRQANLGDMPFAIIHSASGTPIGSTRYIDVRPKDRGLEIGWTWIAKAFQRSAVNTECKYLLMRHAFEDLSALRVCLKTDLRNVRSQNAIARIGAVKEAVLRQHVVCHDGYIRDSVYFSVIDTEWPAVKARLQAMMDAGTAQGVAR